MDSIKAQDIIRHIFKDEDKGVAYVTGLSITDGVEVLTKVLPELIKKAQEKNNVNDEGYFNEIADVYRRIIVDKLLNADHLGAIPAVAVIPVVSYTSSITFAVSCLAVILYSFI